MKNTKKYYYYIYKKSAKRLEVSFCMEIILSLQKENKTESINSVYFLLNRSYSFPEQWYTKDNDTSNKLTTIQT